jgi:hypothetical protein
MSKCTDVIRKLTEVHRKWLQETAPLLLEEAAESLAQDLEEGELASLRGSQVSLSHFATYYGIKGVVGLVDGQHDAWDNVYLSCSFHLHRLRLWFALWTRLSDEISLTFTIGQVACSLCFCLANGLPEWTRLFADILAQAEWNDRLVERRYWQGRKFEPFALHLSQACASDVAIAPLEGSALGIYSDVLNNWNSPGRLSQTLETVCEYHCQNMEDIWRKDNWDPEFDHPPFDLIPWEVLAIRQIRHQVGLPTPQPTHPLLAHLNGFAPRSEVPTDDRIVAVERLRESLGMTVKA